MIIQLEISDSLPEGRRSSFKKGIVDILIASATSQTDLGHTPEGHEIYREQGRQVGEKLASQIQSHYPR